MKLRTLVIGLLSLIAAAQWAAPRPAAGAVFQYAVPVTTEKAQSEAFLWIPPTATQVRGVVMAGMTLMEREFAKDAQIRQACADAQLAIVFLKCGLGAADLQKVLDDCAKASGYRELATAPLLFVGHSAGGPQAKAAAIANADRCIGLVQYRGGVPGAGKDAKDATVPPGVPVLMMIAQFDEFGGTMRDDTGRETWQGGRDAMCAWRASDERNLGTVVVEPGAGHFAWSDRNAAYLATWIRKAAHARIPADASTDGKSPVKCRVVEPTSGWLTDPSIRSTDQAAPAPYAAFKGDRAKANWHFDEELAKATVAYHHPPIGGFGRKDQFIRWTDKYSVDAGARYFFSEIHWIGDGQTFEVHPVYAETYPKTQPNGQGPKWAQAGQPVGHANVPILVKAVSGPVVAVSPTALRFQFDALAPASAGGRVTFMAYSTGDDQYRYTEQVGMLPRGFKGLTAGKQQTITFPPVGNLKPGAGPLLLKATSDAGLPVAYYVAYGPATIEDDQLVLAELPARAKFPIDVKIVAYQFGRATDPQVRTAAPVEQVIQIQQR